MEEALAQTLLAFRGDSKSPTPGNQSSRPQIIHGTSALDAHPRLGDQYQVAELPVCRRGGVRELRESCVKSEERGTPQDDFQTQ